MRVTGWARQERQLIPDLKESNSWLYSKVNQTLVIICLQGNWDTSGSELSEGELEKQRRTLLEQLDEDQ